MRGAGAAATKALADASMSTAGVAMRGAGAAAEVALKGGNLARVSGEAVLKVATTPFKSWAHEHVAGSDGAIEPFDADRHGAVHDQPSALFPLFLISSWYARSTSWR